MSANENEVPKTDMPVTKPPAEGVVGKDSEGVMLPEAQKRIADFIDAYGALVKEHGIDFASYPMFVPDGQGGFKIVVQNQPVDIANQPVKSPFVPQ